MKRPKSLRRAALLAAALLITNLSGCEDDDPAPAMDGGSEKSDATAEAGDDAEDASELPDAATSAPDASCEPADGGADEYIDGLENSLLHTLGPLPAVPADSTNRFANLPLAAALGQKLFFDKRFSGALRVSSDLGAVGETGKVSCASCHSSPYLDDARSLPDNVSLGTDFHTRNAPPLVNAAFYKWTNWGGRFSAQWELPLAVLENPIIMNGSRLQLAHRIFEAYRAEYEAIFGPLPPELADSARFPAAGKPKPAPSETAPNPPDGPWELMTGGDRLLVNTILVNYSKALAAYMRLLVSRDAPFDSWLAGDDGALSPAAKRGAKLFVGKAGCVSCHAGPHFSDDDFHNIGVPQSGEHVPASDDGRFKDVPPLLSSPFNSKGAFSDDPNSNLLADLSNPMPERYRGAFRTPSLRGVALTAPYMHAGQIATLEGVISFYNRGGGTPASGSKDPRLVPLLLSDSERADLVSFLEALTGAPVAPALLVDTSAP